MIDKILGKFGYIKEENLKEIMRERDFYAKALGHEATERNACLEHCEDLKKKISALEENAKAFDAENMKLKRELADEINKRLEIMKHLNRVSPYTE